MNAGQISILCWVIFVVGMLAMLPAGVGGIVGIVAEQAVTWTAFVYAMYLSMVVIRGGDKRLMKRGMPGTAKVLSAKQTNTVVQAGEFEWEAPYVWKYGLEVTLPDRDSYRTTLYICAHLSEGETIPVRASKLNPKRVTIDREAYDAQYRARTPRAEASEFGSGIFVADELAKLAALRDSGVLTGAEFSAQKAKLLGE